MEYVYDLANKVLRVRGLAPAFHAIHSASAPSWSLRSGQRQGGDSDFRSVLMFPEKMTQERDRKNSRGERTAIPSYTPSFKR